jgi:CubicO group peptidase (beta-lactamase class C family)
VEARVARLCRAAVQKRLFPGCVVGFWRGDGGDGGGRDVASGGRPDGGRHGSAEAVVWPFGRLTYEANSPEVTAGTVYDVASITKSIPTGSLALMLAEEGRLGLDDRLVDYVPEVRSAEREQILIRHLLEYTVVFDIPGGLAAVARRSPDEVLGRVLNAPLAAVPGTRYAYTNAPAILLGLVIERVCGRRLDVAAQERLFGPLGMRQTTFYPEALGAGVVAPTEVENGVEVRGRVHDEGAWALRQMGVVAGNAGLFSTAGDLLRFGRMLVAGGEFEGKRIFKPGTIELMHTNQIADLGESAGLGWELNRAVVTGSAGSDQMFGKTGFTGCIVMMNPVKRRTLVHLSNHTYPHRPQTREAIFAFRRELAGILFAD